MTIDIHPDLGPVTHHRVECVSCGAHSERIAEAIDAAAYALAIDHGHAHLAACQRRAACARSAIAIARTDDLNAPWVSLSTADGHAVLAVLGLRYTDGAATPAELSAALSIATAPATLAAVAGPAPAHADRDAAVQELLVALVPVIEWAHAHGRDVVWA